MRYVTEEQSKKEPKDAAEPASKGSEATSGECSIPLTSGDDARSSPSFQV